MTNLRKKQYYKNRNKIQRKALKLGKISAERVRELK